MQSSFAAVSGPLAERWRPTAWADVAGQDKVVGKLRKLRKLADEDRLAGRALWIAGPSGTGKTTLARLAAGEVADDWCIEEIDAGSLTVANLEALERSWSLRGMGKGGRAYLVNEAHGLRKPCIRQLLVMLERIPPHVLVIFTTTVDGQDSLFEDCDDASPLLSRCLRLNLAQRDLLKPFSDRLRTIFPTVAPERIERTLKDNRNNLRASIHALENWELEQ